MLLLHFLHRLQYGAGGAQGERFQASFRLHCGSTEKKGLHTALVSPCWFFAWLVFGIVQFNTSSNNGVACCPM